MLITLQSTTFSAHGGIPTYNRLVCRALNEFTGSSDKRALVATDAPIDIEHCEQTLPHLRVTGFSASRSVFVGQVLKIALTQRIELVLIGHVNYAPLGLVLKRLQPGLRYGVMGHGIDVWSKLPRIKRWALQKADFVTSVSEYTKRQAVDVNGVDQERIHILPNALEWQESPMSQVQCPKSNGGVKLLSVCRLDSNERYKGVDTVIEALPSIIRSVPEVQYFVIGTGTDLGRLKQLAAQHGVSERVHFPGAVDEATLRAYYRDCDIFVMPSSGEGFGIVFLEAMRYRKPVVAAASGAVPEVVQDGVTGKLIEYGNQRQLADAIVELASNPALRMSLGEAGYIRLQENFTFDHFQRRLNAILNQELPARAVYRSRREAAIGVTGVA